MAEPYLLKPWLTLDLWTCEQAIALLSGSEPDAEHGGVIDFPEYDFHEHFAEGIPCFLDGLGYDDHPRREQSIDDTMTLIRIMRNIDRDECRSPAEWLAYAERNGFEPYWLAWAREHGYLTASSNPAKLATLAGSGSTAADNTREGAVMRAILELKYDPQNFPRGKRGVRGARAEVIDKAGGDARKNNKALDRMIEKGVVVLTRSNPPD